jgi:hypothetical protein
LDQAGKMFPDNGTVFYMLSIANRMVGKKLPAILAARHSVEVFQAQQDRENMLKSAALLHQLVDIPDAQFTPVKKNETLQAALTPKADAPQAAPEEKANAPQAAPAAKNNAPQTEENTPDQNFGQFK